MTEERKRELPSFWMPCMGPQAKKTKLVKPDKTVYCPISRQPLRVKDLVDVQWTETRDPDDKKKLIAREERYHCAVTGDILNNASQCAVIRTTGHVVTKDCVEKIIKKVGTYKNGPNPAEFSGIVGTVPTVFCYLLVYYLP